MSMWEQTTPPDGKPRGLHAPRDKPYQARGVPDTKLVGLSHVKARNRVARQLAARKAGTTEHSRSRATDDDDGEVMRTGRVLRPFFPADSPPKKPHPPSRGAMGSRRRRIREVEEVSPRYSRTRVSNLQEYNGFRRLFNAVKESTLRVKAMRGGPKRSLFELEIATPRGLAQPSLGDNSIWDAGRYDERALPSPDEYARMQRSPRSRGGMPGAGRTSPGRGSGPSGGRSLPPVQTSVAVKTQDGSGDTAARMSPRAEDVVAGLAPPTPRTAARGSLGQGQGRRGGGNRSSRRPSIAASMFVTTQRDYPSLAAMAAEMTPQDFASAAFDKVRNGGLIGVNIGADGHGHAPTSLITGAGGAASARSAARSASRLSWGDKDDGVRSATPATEASATAGGKRQNRPWSAGSDATVDSVVREGGQVVPRTPSPTPYLNLEHRVPSKPPAEIPTLKEALNAARLKAAGRPIEPKEDDEEGLRKKVHRKLHERFMAFKDGGLYLSGAFTKADRRRRREAERAASGVAGLPGGAALDDAARAAAGATAGTDKLRNPPSLTRVKLDAGLRPDEVVGCGDLFEFAKRASVEQLKVMLEALDTEREETLRHKFLALTYMVESGVNDIPQEEIRWIRSEAQVNRAYETERRARGTQWWNTLVEHVAEYMVRRKVGAPERALMSQIRTWLVRGEQITEAHIFDLALELTAKEHRRTIVQLIFTYMRRLLSISLAGWEKFHELHGLGRPIECAVAEQYADVSRLLATCSACADLTRHCDRDEQEARLYQRINRAAMRPKGSP